MYACALVELELHFPERGRGRQTRAAKQVCAKCEVREACLERAIENREPYGIWGGMTERERHEEIKRRAGLTAEPALLSASA
jgi:WhiB family redox-sensing transcriptional regulator